MKKILFILFFTFAFLTQSIFASEKPILYSAKNPSEPLAPAYLLRSHPAQTVGRLGPSMPLLYDPLQWMEENRAMIATASADDCNLNAMLALTSPAAVVNYLKTHSFTCLAFLWTYTTDLKRIFTQNNLTAVGNEISRLASGYAGTNAGNIRELLYFIRIAYYQNFYYPSDYDINTLKPFIATTLNKLFANNRVYDPTDEAGSILDQLINTMDSAQLNASFTSAIEQTLNALYANLNTRLPFYQQQSCVYSILFTIYRSAYNRTITSIPTTTIDALKKYGLLSFTDKDYFYIPSNAAWALGNIAASIAASKTPAFSALEAIYNFQPQWSTPWLWSVSALTIKNDCETLPTSGRQVCLSQTRNDLKARLFTNTFNFENNTLLFNTGLSRDTVEPIYYATKEVKAQFGRVLRKLTPVPNDPNQALKIILYSTLSDYSDYHTFLFNLDSNNGGIYIEQNGTYYTYQRTSSESIYTLQELARHEYTHYLVGRYLVPGMWGEVPIYNNNRMVFFDEGIAEFFAGSLPRDTIAQRASLVKQIKSDGTSRRLKISDIVTGTYDTYGIYRYSGLFFHFLYTKHLDILNNFTSLLYVSNVSGFDTLIQQLKNNTSLNTEYQSYLDQAVANLNQLGTPTSTAPTSSNLVYSTPSQIASLLSSTQMVTETTCSTVANQTNIVFNCTGKIAGSSTSSQNTIADWYTINSKVNQLLKTLVQNSPNTNVNWMTCRFEAIQWKTDGGSGFIPFSQYACEGPLGTGTPPPSDGVQLTNGVPITNISDVKGSNRYYYIDVPQSVSTLTIKSYGGTGDADLYVRFNNKPDTGTFDCRSNSYSNNETCTFTPPSKGRYMILLRGYAVYDGASVVATY